MRVLVLLSVIAAGCATSRIPHTACPTPYRPSVASGQPFVWEVRRPGTPTSITLFGTYHVAGESDVPAAAWDALARSSVFVAEVDEVPARDRGSNVITGMLHLPPGTELDGLLSHDAFNRLADLLDEVPRETLRHMKPWVAMFLLTKQAYDFPDPQMSEALLGRARARSLRTDFFDTLLDQMRFLDASAGTIKLEEAIAKVPYMHCGLSRRVEAYRAGDDLLFTSDIPDAGDPIIDRLDRWQRRVERYLTDGEQAFIAIGTANLLGPYGLVARLRAQGYDVRRYDEHVWIEHVAAR